MLSAGCFGSIQNMIPDIFLWVSLQMEPVALATAEKLLVYVSDADNCSHPLSIPWRCSLLIPSATEANISFV